MKAFLWFFLVGVPALAFNGKISEENYTLTAIDRGSFQEVILEGTIHLGDDNYVVPFLNNLPQGKPILLVLNFRGGFDWALAAIANTLKEKCSYARGCRINTLIPQFSNCMSYCIPLFMLGYNRTAYENSFFGFHTTTSGPFNFPSEMARHYLAAGVHPDWFRQNANMFKFREMTIRGPLEITDSNITTQILNTEGRVVWSQL